jgi:hypothetical protein
MRRDKVARRYVLLDEELAFYDKTDQTRELHKKHRRAREEGR